MLPGNVRLTAGSVGFYILQKYQKICAIRKHGAGAPQHLQGDALGK